MPYKDPVKNAECKARWAKTPEAKAKKKAYYQKYKLTAKYKYTQARKGALRRGIEWLFTFETWCQVWSDSGHWSRRSPTRYCMCRFGDEGPYSIENVYIAHASQNKRDAYLNGKIHNIAQYNRQGDLR